MKKKNIFLTSLILAGSLFWGIITVGAAANTAEVVQKCQNELKIVEIKAQELEAEAQELWTQTDMNFNAAERYKLWDDEINVLWGHLKEILDAETMEDLTRDEIAWIRDKEAQIEAEGKKYEGGSMRPMVEDSLGADLTKERVYFLMDFVPYIEGIYTGPGVNGPVEFEMVQTKEEHKALFGKVLGQYKKVQSENFYLDIESDEPLDYPYYVNPNVTALARMVPDYKLYYAFLDIDKDGIDELFIGGGSEKEMATFIDVFDLKEDGPLRYFEPYDLGPRVYMSLYENGMMEVRWSDSAADSGYDFYFPNENGYTRDCLSIHGGDDSSIGYYHSFWTETPITAEKFYEIYNSYTSQWLLPMEWKRLK